MKKVILIFLFLAGTANALHAQNRGFFYQGTYYFESRPSTTDFLFNFPKPGKTKVVFQFFNVHKSSRVVFELSNIKQIKDLPNLDSMLLVVKAKLLYLSDSLKQDGIVRRVDYVMGGKVPQIRITNHTDIAKTYTIANGELSDLKVEQDTLRIKYYTVSSDSLKIWKDGKMQKQQKLEAFFITLHINNIADINNLPPTVLQNCLTKLKEEITDEYVQHASNRSNYYAAFNMANNTMFSPTKTKYIKYGGQRQELVPNIYSSLQFTGGSFVPSIALGLRYTFSNRSITTKRIYAMWEPHYFFSRDADNKLITDRNDFLTFRFTETENRNADKFNFVSNFSVGYLIKQQGNWLEPKTIKIGLPGIRFGWLQIEPEIFCTKQFKTFSPSLKVTLHYE